MYMIEIKEDEQYSVNECVEKGLKYLRKVVHCLEELEEHQDSNATSK